MTKEMEEWAYYAMDAIHQEAQKDENYLELKAKWTQLAADFEAFVSQLPDRQRELVLEYQCCVEDLQFQQVRVAYFLGKKHRDDSEKSSCNQEKSML